MDAEEEIRADPPPDDPAAQPPLRVRTMSGRAPGEPQKEQENAPKDDEFHQQRLPAWTPIHRPIWVIGAFLLIGVLFLLIGGALLAASRAVFQLSVDYSDCGADCVKEFEVATEQTGPFMIYYGVSGFWQNHRRYWKSKEDKQLLGDLDDLGDCAPFTKNADGQVYVPCGAIANSMFSDTFELKYLKSPDLLYRVETTTKDIDWSRFRNKYNNPKGKSNLVGMSSRYPPAWQNVPFFRDLMEAGGGLEDARFSVWMSQAAFPSFRKPWARIDQERNEPPFRDGKLPAGKYSLRINNRWNISSFGGEKRFILSSYGWAGGKNHFLAVAYLGSGAACVVASVAFALLHWRFGMTFDEMAQNVGDRKDNTWRW